MIPVSKPSLPSLAQLNTYLEAPFASGQITNGPVVAAFESKLADMAGVTYAVATSSNTIGMMLAWKSCNFAPNAEVILPSFTFLASAHALHWAGLKPVFVDIDPHTYLLDADCVEAAITDATVALLGVTLWGNPCDDTRLGALAKKHALTLFYDSAQGMGSRCKGAFLGGRGDAEIFSFSPTKLITTAEGGAVLTNDEKIASFVRTNRNYGLDGYANSAAVGLNGRMSEMHAALGLCSFTTMDRAIIRRQEVVCRYRETLSHISGISFQEMSEGSQGNGVYFGIFIDEHLFGMSRDKLAALLLKEGVQTRAYGSPPVHELDCYATLDTVDLPHTKRASQQVLVLPLFSDITDDEVSTVLRIIETA